MTVGRCGTRHWSAPDDVIGRDLVEQIVNVAAALVPEEDGAFTTVAELELWVAHIQPVWKTDTKSMRMALVNCYSDAQQRGVLKGNNQNVDPIEQFILGGLGTDGQ